MKNENLIIMNINLKNVMERSFVLLIFFIRSTSGI